MKRARLPMGDVVEMPGAVMIRTYTDVDMISGRWRILFSKTS